MASKSAQQVLNDLAAMHDLVNKHTGKLNYSAFSRRTGIPHPTLIRIMQAGPDHTMNTETIDALIRAFRITFAQARGEVPVRARDRHKFTPSDSDIELVRRVRNLPKADQDDIRKLVELREQLGKK